MSDEHWYDSQAGRTYQQAISVSGMPPRARHAALSLATFANPAGVAAVSHTALAHGTGMSVRSALRALDVAIREGYVIPLEECVYQLASPVDGGR